MASVQERKVWELRPFRDMPTYSRWFRPRSEPGSSGSTSHSRVEQLAISTQPQQGQSVAVACDSEALESERRALGRERQALDDRRRSLEAAQQKLERGQQTLESQQRALDNSRNAHDPKVQKEITAFQRDKAALEASTQQLQGQQAATSLGGQPSIEAIDNESKRI